MPRRHRDTAAGCFHVYTHSVWSASLYRDDVDRMRFLRELAAATATAQWKCLAFCLMTSHHHLLLEVGDGALPAGMHRLNFRYASQFNARHGARGHVQGARYDSRRITDTDDLVGCYRYIVRNPVAALLCETPAAWRWSSYGGTINAVPPHSFVDATRVINCFSGSRELKIAQLRSFVEKS